MKWLRKFAANNIKNNASYNFRKKRILLFNNLLVKLNLNSVTIVDIGGSSKFWEYWSNQIGSETNVVIVNIDKNDINSKNGIIGDAANFFFC